ncbi:hypothetical protein GW17_00009047 [Ensete ventricosum]|nr:hypothetical protein GW17_00009047 [Ensete ventricosum]
MINRAYSQDAVAISILVNALTKNGTAQGLGLSIDEKAYTNMISYYGKAGRTEEASLLFTKMMEVGILPGRVFHSGRYVPVHQLTGTRTTCYRSVLSGSGCFRPLLHDFDCRRLISSGISEGRRKKKREKKREKKRTWRFLYPIHHAIRCPRAKTVGEEDEEVEEEEGEEEENLEISSPDPSPMSEDRGRFLLPSWEEMSPCMGRRNEATSALFFFELILYYIIPSGMPYAYRLVPSTVPS